MKVLLHVGCGSNKIDQTTRGFNNATWQEVRFDIDSNAKPDVIGTMTDMAAVSSGSIDAIFSSHNIEHLHAHEVAQALSEFLRVLSDDGFAVITCPDLKSVSALIAEDRLTDVAYESPGGPITPLDILYGHRASIQRGNVYMAHHVGFTQKVLHATLENAGFKTVATWCRGFKPFFDLWAIASKSERSPETMHELAALHFPLPQSQN